MEFIVFLGNWDFRRKMRVGKWIIKILIKIKSFSGKKMGKAYDMVLSTKRQILDFYII